MAAYCGGGVGARLNSVVAAVVAARIVTAEIVGDGPNSAAVVVDAADP